jgi:hypothetical protein
MSFVMDNCTAADADDGVSPIRTRETRSVNPGPCGRVAEIIDCTAELSMMDCVRGDHLAVLVIELLFC